jgi:hypothetical protein
MVAAAEVHAAQRQDVVVVAAVTDLDVPCSDLLAVGGIEAPPSGTGDRDLRPGVCF